MEQQQLTEAEKRKIDNANKAKALADKEFPDEEWVKVEDGIWISPRRSLEDAVAKNELRDAQILRDIGSTIYLVPHFSRSDVPQYDAIVNGLKVEFKNVGGTPGTLESAFLVSRRQAPNVFINLETSSITRHEATAALVRARNSVSRTAPNGKVRKGYDEINLFPEGGRIVLKLNGHENLIYLNVDDLKV